MIIKRKPNQPPFAFVSFISDETALNALLTFNNKKINGKKLRINFAKPKETSGMPFCPFWMNRQNTLFRANILNYKSNIILQEDKQMTPNEFERKMQEIFNNDDDTELNHEKADALLCEVLTQLGYENGITIFENAKKWYA